jgi:hypothetical protein
MLIYVSNKALYSAQVSKINCAKWIKHDIILTVQVKTMLGGVPVPTAWWVLELWMEERPPAVEVSCEYSEQAAADRLRGVDLQLGDWAWGSCLITRA